MLASGVLPGSLVRVPAAGELVDTLRPGFELDDSAHGAVEESPVVGDDHDACVHRGDEPLEQLEPGEVEVVRRLVQQIHVEPGQQDRSEREPGALAARERARKPVERNVQPDACQRLGRPPVDLVAGAPREVLPDRLARVDVAFLREVADAQPRRGSRDGAAARRVESGEQTEQRRLAAAVRADDADPGNGRDRERDALEDERRTLGDRDLGGGQGCALHVTDLLKTGTAQDCGLRGTWVPVSDPS